MRLNSFAALLLALTLLLASCANEQKETSPIPEDLYKAASENVELPEMADVSEDMLESNTGITEDLYESAAYYIPLESVEPYELIFIKAVDESSAQTIKEKLDEYLEYREKAAQVYLTENMPVIQSAVVRQDGLTVSLIMAPEVDDIIASWPSDK